MIRWPFIRRCTPRAENAIAKRSRLLPHTARSTKLRWPWPPWNWRIGRGGQDAAARPAGGNQRQGQFGEGMKERHVGFYLVDRGRAKCWSSASVFGPALRERVTRIAGGAPLPCYLGAIAAVSGGAGCFGGHYWH